MMWIGLCVIAVPLRRDGAGVKEFCAAPFGMRLAPVSHRLAPRSCTFAIPLTPVSFRSKYDCMLAACLYMGVMKTPVSTPESILSNLIETCLKAGATDADASFGKSEGISVEVREGKLEGIERSESQGVSLRCLFGKRQASVSGSDTSDSALKTLAERCVAMAKAVPEDLYCGLAPEADLVRDMPELDLTGDGEIPTEQLEKDALEAETAALAVSGVKTVSSCGNGWSRGESWVAASNGFFAHRSDGSTGLGLAAVAERDGAMERDYESRSVRRLEDRPSATEIGRIAGERTVARLGPRKLKTQNGCCDL